MAEARVDILADLVDFLKQLEVQKGDFAGKAKGAEGKKAHQKAVEGLGEKAKIFLEHPLLGYGAHDIDVVLRRRGWWDKVLFAAEVDTGHLPHGNWVKLVDIRADNKMWVYLTDHPQAQATELFQEGVKQIREMLKYRDEDKLSFGKFVLVLKSLQAFKVVDAFGYRTS